MDIFDGANSKCLGTLSTCMPLQLPVTCSMANLIFIVWSANEIIMAVSLVFVNNDLYIHAPNLTAFLTQTSPDVSDLSY